MFYSAQTRGFYNREIHGDNIPADAVEITTEEWQALLDGQTRGKQVVAGKGGKPELQDPPLPVSVVPAKVTMRQARLALLEAGYVDSVQEAIASIPDETARKAAGIEWEYAQTVDRDSETMMFIANALGLTEEQLDNLFTTAAAL